MSSFKRQVITACVGICILSRQDLLYKKVYKGCNTQRHLSMPLIPLDVLTTMMTDYDSASYMKGYSDGMADSHLAHYDDFAWSNMSITWITGTCMCLTSLVGLVSALVIIYRMEKRINADGYNAAYMKKLRLHKLGNECAHTA